MVVKVSPIAADIYNPQTSHRFMKSMASGGLARFIMLEGIVEAGRTYQATKRGGFDEGRERITEEFTGAVFWLGGVKFFNAINDKIGKWALGLRTADFDLGSDKARNPLANFLHNEKSTKTGRAFTESQIAKFKSAKLIASILMANTMIGFVVPRLNQAITRAYHKKDKNNNPQQQQNQNIINMPVMGMDKFLSNAKKDKKNVSFSGSPLMSLAFNLENNTTWQLLSTDVGTAGGRTISARNNDERREILFRDLTSIYFYMFNMPNMNKWLNKIEQNGRATRVDSVNADYTAKHMQEILKANNGKLTPEELAHEMFGHEANELFKGKFKNFTETEINIPQKVKDAFKDGFMPIETFKQKITEFVPAAEVEKYTKLAEKMSALQPKVAGVGRITIEQAERVFKGGYLNDPEFLKNLYEISFGKDKKSGIANYLNPYKFISDGDVNLVDSDLKYFVQQIIEKASNAGKDITSEVIEKAAKSNFRKNVFNWGSGFVVSALFLSTFIPKIQYWLTKKITGSNAFPGTEEYAKQNQTANNNTSVNKK